MTVGRDAYLGTAEEVVGFMARGEGAPGAGDRQAFMRGVAERLLARGAGPVPFDTAAAFLQALAAAGWLRIEARPEGREERLAPDEVRRLVEDHPIAFGEHLPYDQLRRDLFGEDE